MINVHFKTSELIKAGFAFGLGLQLSSAAIVFAVTLIKESAKKSKKKLKMMKKQRNKIFYFL